MPVVHPADIWQATNRWYEVGSEMGRFLDKNERDMVLAMTHEEVVADLAGSPGLVPRVRRKIRAFLRPLAAVGKLRRDSAERLLRNGYRRVPERYHVDIEQSVEALRKGRWRLV